MSPIKSSYPPYFLSFHTYFSLIQRQRQNSWHILYLTFNILNYSTLGLVLKMIHHSFKYNSTCLWKWKNISESFVHFFPHVFISNSTLYILFSLKKTKNISRGFTCWKLQKIQTEGKMKCYFRNTFLRLKLQRENNNHLFVPGWDDLVPSSLKSLVSNFIW